VYFIFILFISKVIFGNEDSNGDAFFQTLVRHIYLYLLDWDQRFIL